MENTPVYSSVHLNFAAQQYEKDGQEEGSEGRPGLQSIFTRHFLFPLCFNANHRLSLVDSHQSPRASNLQLSLT